MSGLDVIGAISAVSGLLDSTIGLIERLRKTYDDQKNSTQVLGNHAIEIQRILTILELVKNEADLQTAGVISEVDNIRKISEKLISTLEPMMPGDKSKARRFVHQLAKGEQEQEAVAKLLQQLDRAKSNLSLSLHVANVGVTRVVGDSVAINTDILNRIDKLLRKVFGEDGGLKISDAVKHQPFADDGLVHIKTWDLVSRMSDGELAQERLKDARPSRIVLRNITRDQAFQINGPIGDEGWREVAHLEITDNVASETSVQINHAISVDVFKKMLACREQNTTNVYTIES